MNQDQVYAYLRTICTMIASVAGFSATQTTQITSLALGIASGTFLAISLYGTWKANTLKARVASVAINPEVDKVVMKPTDEGHAIADTLPANVVTK